MFRFCVLFQVICLVCLVLITTACSGGGPGSGAPKAPPAPPPPFGAPAPTPGTGSSASNPVFAISVGAGGATEYAPGTVGAGLASFTLDASGAMEAIRVSGLPLVIFVSNGGQVSHLTGLQVLVSGVTPANTGSGVGNPSGATALLAYDNPVEVPTGASRQLLLIGNISAAAPVGAVFQVGIDIDNLAGLGAVGAVSGREAFVAQTTSSPLAPAISLRSSALAIARDATNPSEYMATPGSGRIVVVPSFLASGGNVLLETVIVELRAGQAQAVERVEIFAGSNRVASGIFGGSNRLELRLTKNLFVQSGVPTPLPVTLVLSSIGPGEAMQTSGGFIAVDVIGAVGVGVETGATVLATGSARSNGLRLYQAIMQAGHDTTSLPQSGVEDRKILRFAMRGEGGAVGVGRLPFRVVTQNATISTVELFAFTDANYSLPYLQARGDGSLTVNPVPVGADGVAVVRPEDFSGNRSAAQAPPSSLFFELRATAITGTTTGSTAVVQTTLEGDSARVPQDGTATFATVEGSGGRIIWSPNSLGRTTASSPDWLNSHGVLVIPPEGFTTIRTTTVGNPQHGS
ncbi:MAG: hypothetical protein COV10_04935 [Candidatus Vogelbacteria bacterium CG10_big_fil_rev_8_21_14_0_10_51_16]|uniref:DUF5666 domain-containing protein n=1 Tax=Candidatus Vogelbacteria bacterium CG10_big_fil_rev_8_21_14_0_10_51_16 TaxID=1975045 RepID=A0A2H0RF74_9BACT|nr:MAG: hypothetical protein COV10_04935 [Candidatus Vogelbacteria bacterium CG10_big_fil_rev_8_21_14_0_10_51_16]